MTKETGQDTFSENTISLTHREHRPAARGMPLLWLTFGAGRKFTNHKFLEQSAGCAFSRAGCDIFKRKARAAIAGRIVRIRNGARDQVAANARIIGLPPTIVALAGERRGQRIQRPLFDGSCSLIEVARVLVQKRRQDRAAEHRVREAVGIDGAKALAISARSLHIVGRALWRR